MELKKYKESSVNIFYAFSDNDKKNCDLELDTSYWFMEVTDLDKNDCNTWFVSYDSNNMRRYVLLNEALEGVAYRDNAKFKLLAEEFKNLLKNEEDIKQSLNKGEK